jgi:hypothetical protein
MLIDNVTMREVVSAGAGVAAKPATPEGFVLEQNYPNPFNPWTELVYRLDRPCEISLAVYNQTGQRVQQLVRAQQGPGAYRVVWNGSDENRIDQPSGIYYARLTDGEFTRTVKLALVR